MLSSSKDWTEERRLVQQGHIVDSLVIMDPAASVAIFVATVSPENREND